MEATRRAKQRAAFENWKMLNYDYWLAQKRFLSSRDSYKAHRRARYHEKMAALRATEGYVAPIRGRPRIYSPKEAAERRRESAREWAVQNRIKNYISNINKYQQHEYDTTQAGSSESD